MATRTTTKNSVSPATTEKAKAAKPAKAVAEAETPKKAPAAKPASSAASAALDAPRAKSSTTQPAAPAKAKPQVSSEQRRQYVAEAAYFIAERRGFVGGTEHQDWLEAEVLIERMLSGNV